MTELEAFLVERLTALDFDRHEVHHVGCSRYGDGSEPYDSEAGCDCGWPELLRIDLAGKAAIIAMRPGLDVLRQLVRPFAMHPRFNSDWCEPHPTVAIGSTVAEVLARLPEGTVVTPATEAGQNQDKGHHG